MTIPGTVYLIGAGPGERDLITVRGVECLRRADIILYDYLVNPDILAFASDQAEHICLGRHGGRRWTQAEICEQLVTAAKKGQTVARLKGGDPMIFGRATEELTALSEAGIPYEIVPGVTTAVAAASYLGIPITARDTASAVAFVTGQEHPDKSPPEQLNYEALARFPGTLVFYMSVTTAENWTQRLLNAGMSPDCPVALVRRCSWPDQRVVRCRLDEVVAQVTPRHKLPPPVIAIVGDAAGLDVSWNWFARRPLHGHSVLVTRPQRQADEVSERLRDWGAEVIHQPALEIMPPADWADIDDCLTDWNQYRWAIFSSANGVRGLMDRVKRTQRDIRSLAGPQLAAVGPGTADALSEFLFSHIVQPTSNYRAESLVELLQDRVAGEHVLVVHGSRSRDVLASGLRAAGANVREVIVYRNEDVSALSPDVARRLESLTNLWVLATSSASARSLHRMLKPLMDGVSHAQPLRVHWASLSPLTTSALNDLGESVEVEAKEATMVSLLESLRRVLDTHHSAS